MSTKNEPGPFDGLERAAPDEPVFTLRAHDVLAPALVHEWVRQRREAINGADISDEKRELELIQCREAEEIAWSMVDWRNGTHPIEEPKEAKTPVPYSGHTSSAEELAAKRRYDVVKGASSGLNNALSEVVDVAGALAEYGYDPERAVILAAADRIKAVAIHIAPKRASYSTVDPEPEPFPIDALPDDMVRLIIAARAVAFNGSVSANGYEPAADELRELDKASEAFASRVPWDDEPEQDDADPA